MDNLCRNTPFQNEVHAPAIREIETYIGLSELH